jgi:uncharacterized protein (UPF0332 family)
MSYDKFVSEYLSKGLIQKQKSSITDVERLLIRSIKDLKTARANLKIDEGIAYTVAYLAMLRAGRAFMLLKGFRPSDGYQHKTVWSLCIRCLVRNTVTLSSISTGCAENVIYLPMKLI